MIEAHGLKKSFRQKGFRKLPITALNDVSFQAADGKITGLLGANGAGKSTTLRILSGLIKPDSGFAKINQFDTIKEPLKAKNTIGYLPHNAGIYQRLSARENIVYFGRLSGLAQAEAEERAIHLAEQLDMKAFIDRRCDGFSQGQQTKVALARSLVHRPQNLILDEPTNGLDVLSTRMLRSLLLNLKAQGHCILISSHIMQEISLLCDHIAIINQGSIAIEGSIQDILEETQQTDFEEAFVQAIKGKGV